MKGKVFFGEGMARTKSEYPDIYDAIIELDKAVFGGKALDYKTQKLIAIGINASRSDETATRKQMVSGMKELGISKEEIVDVLRVVLLTSGMPPFTKGMKILYELVDK